MVPYRIPYCCPSPSFWPLLMGHALVPGWAWQQHQQQASTSRNSSRAHASKAAKCS